MLLSSARHATAAFLAAGPLPDAAGLCQALSEILYTKMSSNGCSPDPSSLQQTVNVKIQPLGMMTHMSAACNAALLTCKQDRGHATSIASIYLMMTTEADHKLSKAELRFSGRSRHRMSHSCLSLRRITHTDMRGHKRIIRGIAHFYFRLQISCRAHAIVVTPTCSSCLHERQCSDPLAQQCGSI